MIIRPSQLSSKVSLTYFFLTKYFSRKHVLPQVNACQEKKERKAPASAAAGLKKIHKLEATFTSELITIHNPNISIFLFFCNCIFSTQETKLEDHSPSQVKEKTLQPLDIGFYRLGMQAAMARLTTVCKKPILLDIRSMVTVLICSITSFFQVMRTHQLDVSQQAQFRLKKIATFCSGILQQLIMDWLRARHRFLL